MRAKPCVLLVDRLPIPCDLISFLERSGFIVATARQEEETLSLVHSLKPDLIILDVLLPKINGRDVLRSLRENGDWTPIIILSEVGDPLEQAMALDEGADDYILKPFVPLELVSRIKAVLRRATTKSHTTSSPDCLISGDLQFEPTSHRAYLRGEPLKLTSKALVLLGFLMTHSGQLLTRDQLLDAVWGWDFPLGTRAIDTRIAEIRLALYDDAKMPIFIDTVRGYGYRFLGEVKVVNK